MTSCARTVEPLAHFLAGLEERHRLLLHRDVGAGARVASGPGRAILHGEGSEAAQLDAVAARHRGDDLAENGIDDVLDVALVEMRVLRGDALHELGFDHRCRPSLGERKLSALLLEHDPCRKRYPPRIKSGAGFFGIML